MATVAMILFDAGELIYSTVTGLAPKPDITRVNILVGSSDTDDTLGGNAPYVTLYDNYGKWMGTHQPTDRKKVWEGGKTIEGGNGGIDIKHVSSHTEPRASYIMLSNAENNAICIASITVADLSVQTSWAGDSGKYCGMPWYPSNVEVGQSRRTPKCVWLDGDNTNGLPKALSFQLDAFAESADKIAQYLEYDDTLCRSTPRFSIWQDLVYFSPIPIFDPPLKYEKDFATGGQGGDLNFSRIVDSDLCKYDKETAKQLQLDKSCEQKGVKLSNMGFIGSFGASGKRQEQRRRPEDTTTLSTRFASQLVVSSKSSHNATEVCDSETSFGPDFVSTEEGVFCSMSQKKTFPICNGDSNSAEDICFDLEAKTLVMPWSEDAEHTKRVREALPPTNYSLVRRW